MVSVIVALAFHWLVYPVLRKITNRLPSDLDNELVAAIRRPVTIGIVVLGVYLALTVPLGLSSSQHASVDKVASVAGIVLVMMAMVSVVAALFNWYTEHLGPKVGQGGGLVQMLRKFAGAAVYVLGGIMILNHLGINVSPLIAGLGLSGFAVALGLQPTLSNLFAGTYVMTEGVVSPGDYVELEDGTSGYVIEVSWRSVRVRTWGNNLVIIPNSRFSTAILTNYQRPALPVNVYLTCGVSYDSDLYKVEEICGEVMGNLLETDPNAVKEYGHYFGFNDFGDSNVNFWLFLQAQDRLASFTVRSVLIQRIHTRFREEGIVINYPVRTLYFGEENDPESASQPPAIRPPTARHRPRDRAEGDGPDFG